MKPLTPQQIKDHSCILACGEAMERWTEDFIYTLFLVADDRISTSYITGELNWYIETALNCYKGMAERDFNDRD